MPYYTPPGGKLTAEYARALLGLLPTRYARPAIPTPLVMARAAQALRAAQAAGTMNLVMSGMGLGILPTVNVRYTKTAIPAALASRRWRELHPEAELHGLGRGNAVIVRPAAAVGRAIIAASRPPIAPRSFDVFGAGNVSLAPIKRQAAFFMGPGGGPGGGPFQFPGFSTVRGLSLGQQSEDVCNSDAADNYFLATGRQLPGCGPAPQVDTTSTPVTGQIQPTLPPIVQTALPVFQAGRPVTYAPMPGAPAPSFFSSSTAGIPNTVLAVGVGALLLLGLRRRRRNPSRARSRSSRRRRTR